MSKKQDEQKNAVQVRSPEAQEIFDVLDATNSENPGEADRKRLKEMLEKYPELWEVCGNLAKNALSRTIDSHTKLHNARESIARGLEKIKKDFGYAQAPILERLLIDLICICYVNQYDTQVRYAIAHGSSIALTQGLYWEKRLSATQARYLRACVTLARVRRLSRPAAMQVNIGAQQVNVAQTKETPAKIENGDSPK